LPAEPKPEHKARHDRLGRMTGAAFDAYMKAMVKDHEKAVAAADKKPAGAHKHGGLP
jgi:hypothetical protein